jgi:phage-related holin
MNLPAAALLLQGLSTWIIAAYESMNVVLRWMLWGIGADLFTGILCAAFITKVFSPSFMARGVLVKGTCFAIVVFLAKQPELQIEFKGIQTSVGQLLGVYFLTGEWASALKNLDTLGAPFPKWMSAILQQVHSSVDNIDASKAVSMFTSFTKRTEGNVEVVSKSTTVVTEKAEDPK